jgi:hypothetical protein
MAGGSLMWIVGRSIGGEGGFRPCGREPSLCMVWLFSSVYLVLGCVVTSLLKRGCSSNGRRGVRAAAGYYCLSLRAIARHADHAQRAAPHGRQGVWATAGYYYPRRAHRTPSRLRSIGFFSRTARGMGRRRVLLPFFARHRTPRLPCSASRASRTTMSAGRR